MLLRDKAVVITGGGNGIGAALCRRFAAEAPRGIVVADVDAAAAESVAAEVGGLAVPTDVSVEAEVTRFVARANAAFGPIDLFCSNAGIFGDEGGPEVPNATWQRIWDINVMAHVYAARAVLPQMLARGHGYLLNTASAAGLLTMLGAAAYTATKHAAVGFAEWLSITYGDRGIKVSCLCPQGVRTRMLLGEDGTQESFLLPTALTAEQVADAVVDGLAQEQFLILPHPEVATYFRHKADDYERWLRGMRRLNAEIFSGEA
ncbi:MAG: SDR family oxidoreductase [Anaerolineae bacterium]